MPKNRIYILDILRIISAIGVIVVHTIAGGLSTFDVGSYPRWLVNIVEGFWHWSVPVFLMLTGIFLLRYDKLDEDPIVFYRSRLIKVITPFLICASVFVLFDFFVVKKDFDTYNTLLDFINKGYYFHLRYILVIIGLYIIIPFMRILIKGSQVRLLYLYIFIRLGFKFINQFLVNIFGVPWAGTPSWFLGYDGLAIIGYCIRYHKFIVSWISKKRSIILYILAAIFTVLATGRISIHDGKINDFFYQNNMPNVLIMAISLIVIARHIYDDLHVSDNIAIYIRKLSKTSFGTYMYHPIFIYIYERIFHKLGLSYGINMTLTALFSIISVWIFIYILQKTSIGKKILPET